MGFGAEKERPVAHENLKEHSTPHAASLEDGKA